MKNNKEDRSKELGVRIPSQPTQKLLSSMKI